MGAGGQVLETRVRMVAQPSSVPAVRRFVGEALTSWGRPQLVDDVALSVTELATNATLHSASAYFDVELLAGREAVRLTVVDGGSVPAQFIAGRAERPPAALPAAGRERGADGSAAADQAGAGDPTAEPDAVDLESMTGRGLFIVSVLATRWGIDDLGEGTRVWADFGGAHEGTGAALPTVTTQEAGDAADASDPAHPPPATGPRTVIRLLGCPAALLLAHDDNLADVARELRLFGASHGDAEAVRRSDAIAQVVQASALSWDAARLTARHALEEGRELVDIAFVAVDEENLERDMALLREAVGAAEAMAERGLLMTMPAPGPVQRWRDWVEREITDQVRSGREPRSFLAT